MWLGKRCVFKDGQWLKKDVARGEDVCLGMGTDWGEDVHEEKMLPQVENVSSKKIHS